MSVKYPILNIPIITLYVIFPTYVRLRLSARVFREKKRGRNTEKFERKLERN